MKKINGVVLKDNMLMIALCKKKKFKFSDGDPGEYKIEYDLTKQ